MGYLGNVAYIKFHIKLPKMTGRFVQVWSQCAISIIKPSFMQCTCNVVNKSIYYIFIIIKPPRLETPSDSWESRHKFF